MEILEMGLSSEDEILLQGLISEMLWKIGDNLDRMLEVIQRIERKLG